MIELKRDPETGEVVAYEDGRPAGYVTTMGDMLEGGPSEALDYSGRAQVPGQVPAGRGGASGGLGEASGGRTAWRPTA